MSEEGFSHKDGMVLTDSLLSFPVRPFFCSIKERGSMYRISEVCNHLTSNYIRVDKITLVEFRRRKADQTCDLNINLMN